MAKLKDNPSNPPMKDTRGTGCCSKVTFADTRSASGPRLAFDTEGNEGPLREPVICPLLEFVLAEGFARAGNRLITISNISPRPSHLQFPCGKAKKKTPKLL